MCVYTIQSKTDLEGHFQTNRKLPLPPHSLFLLCVQQQNSEEYIIISSVESYYPNFVTKMIRKQSDCKSQTGYLPHCHEATLIQQRSFSSLTRSNERHKIGSFSRKYMTLCLCRCEEVKVSAVRIKYKIKNKVKIKNKIKIGTLLPFQLHKQIPSLLKL